MQGRLGTGPLPGPQLRRLAPPRGAPRGAVGSSGGERPLPPPCRSRAVEAGGSLTRETPGRVASSPDNDGTGRHCQTVRARQARRDGVREEPALNASQGCHQLQPGGCGLGRGAHRAAAGCRVTPGPVNVAGREATPKVCGVGVARPQGHSRAPRPSIDLVANVGTARTPPAPLAGQVGGGQVRRPLVAPGRGGAAVVVRGRESRPHGEGRQRVRSRSAGRPGARW